MERLHILFKNGKELISSQVPYVQALHWRQALMRDQPIWLVTDAKGLQRVEGKWIEATHLHRDSWNTEEVAAAMLMFPCMVFECDKGFYQFSDVSSSYERGRKLDGYWIWRPAALPYAEDWKPGVVT